MRTLGNCLKPILFLFVCLVCLLLSQPPLAQVCPNLFRLAGKSSEVPGGNINGQPVNPEVGPSGVVEIDPFGGVSGSVNFNPYEPLAGPTDGVWFGPGGQTNQSGWWSWQGANVGNIFDACGGDITFYLKSSESWAARHAGNPTQEYIFDVTDNGSNSLFNFQIVGTLNYFSYALGGPTQTYFIPAGTAETLFGNGVIMKVEMRWDSFNNYLYLNDTLVQIAPYNAPPAPAWGASSLFNIGATAAGFPGYWSCVDSIADFQVSPWNFNCSCIPTPTPPALEAVPCASPGTNPATLTGVINTYYPGVNGTVTTGALAIPVGARVGAAPIAAGDLLLVIQMQGAVINSTNTTNYGDGQGNSSGYTNLQNAGVFEYVIAAGPVAGGNVPLAEPLINTYTEAAATAAQGQETYQVVRVPQYFNATLTSGLTAAPWNGSCGGILAFNDAGTTNLNNATVSVNGLGFRGGGSRNMMDGVGLETDVEDNTPSDWGAQKGEGIAGTPWYVYDGAGEVNTGIEGYPNGSASMGAPGNAGGGATDCIFGVGNYASNAGGGGGGNGGTGGHGGNGLSNADQADAPVGGFGGAGLPANSNRIFLGGGGGAGSMNNSPLPDSSGGRGGGMVFIKSCKISGTGTITANGGAGVDSGTQYPNDGAGGGGAGGSVLALSGAGLGGLTVHADGGMGGTCIGAGQTWELGPGGGGGGGVVLLSNAPAAASANGGMNGLTFGNVPWGSTPGTAGSLSTNIPYPDQSCICGVSPTFTFTATSTATFTNSPTPTSTCTATATPTVSPTATETSTSTATPTFSDTDTPSNTSTITYTATATATDTWMASPTFSDTTTATETSSQTYTPTISNTASSTATITLTTTNTVTSSVTLTSSPTLTPSLSWTPSLTHTQTNTPTVTATNTPVMTNLEMKVYNEAGEVVKTFSNVLVLGGFSGIQLAPGNGSLTFDPSTGLFDIQVKSSGIVYHVPWDGKSDLGYTVDSGQYILKADIPGKTDSTITMSITVLKQGDLLTVSVYTPSGELVKQLYLSYLVQGQLGGMKLTSNLLQISNQPTGTTTIGINIFSSTGQLMADGLGSLNQARLTWDGTTALGNYVQSGEYLIKIDQTYNHQHDVLVQSVTVLSSNLSGFMDASVYPNPYLSTPDHKVWFKVALQDQSNLTVRIYDVVGELVNTLSLPAAGPGIATLGWDVNNAAAGLYVGIVEAASQVSGQTQKKPLKVSIIK